MKGDNTIRRSGDSERIGGLAALLCAISRKRFLRKS
jgi:hypothetical protein